MKTMVFCSYKDGTGKSLAIVNVALCLSRLGKNVALIDLNLDSPGLHFKFREGGLISTKKGGILDYIWQHIQKTKEMVEDKTQPVLAIDTDNEPINDWVNNIQVGRENGTTGKIAFICAGNPYQETYWRQLRQPEMHQIFSFASMGERTKERNAKFFARIKQKISELNPSPDFLLVDCRSGLAEFEMFTVRLWADTIALFFNNNEESIQFFEHSILSFQSILGDNRTPVGIVPVLTRFPSGWEDHQTAEEIRDRLFRKVENVPLCVLHSDRELELQENLRISSEGKTPNTRLAHEYVKLCAYLVNTPEYNKENLEKTIREIGKAVLLDLSEDTQERVFDLKRRLGQLINPHDGEQNVSFKVSTFVNIMEEFHAKTSRIIYEIGKSMEDAVLDTERMFQEAGIICGENFGTSLLHIWNKRTKQQKLSFNLMDVNAKIRAWCEFDSDVGFGRFHYFPPTDDKPHNYSIRLYNNFLAKAPRENGANLCSFMTGYIEGVLHRLAADTSIRVTHPKELCMRLNIKRESCDFIIDQGNA